jgi:hypothetical protein
VHLLRTKLLLARVVTLALLVAVAASPFGRAPLGAPLPATGHAHCPGHTSVNAVASSAEHAGHHAAGHENTLSDPAVHHAPPASDANTPHPSAAKGDAGCCLTAVGVQQKPLAAPLPSALTAQRLAAPDDTAVADLTPDGPQRPPRTRDHA